jgi:hypothetical protein
MPEIDCGRRGTGDLDSACKPADGAALTAPRRIAWDGGSVVPLLSSAAMRSWITRGPINAGAPLGVCWPADVRALPTPHCPGVAEEASVGPAGPRRCDPGRGLARSGRYTPGLESAASLLPWRKRLPSSFPAPLWRWPPGSRGIHLANALLSRCCALTRRCASRPCIDCHYRQRGARHTGDAVVGSDRSR